MRKTPKKLDSISNVYEVQRYAMRITQTAEDE